MSAAGAADGAAIENEIYRGLFVSTFPDTEFLEPSEICNYFKINHVWKLSEEKATDNVRVVASLQFHSLQILSPTLISDGVYRANLEYERVYNVTRITGADLVPQHAYYYLVMKIYELFLHPAASERMFRDDMVDIERFITEQLNSGLADGRAFFEDKIRRFLESNPSFLKSTDEQELQNNINAIWDLLRSDTFKHAGNTVQKGIVSTIAFNDANQYNLASQGRVTDAAEAAFKKTVYGFHVLVYVGGHVISMSLSREHLFHSRPSTVFSFFNSDMIKYMASRNFMNQVYGIINQYNKPEGNMHNELVQLNSLDSDRCALIVAEFGCKSPVLHHKDSPVKITLTTKTTPPGRREPIVGQAGDGRRYILVDNFPLPGSMNTTLYVTSENPNLPNFCEYDNMDTVHRVLGIKFGKDDNDSMKTEGDSFPQLDLLPYSPKPSDPVMVINALVNASRGAAVDAPGAAVAAPGPARDIFGRVRIGVGAACNFIRGIFFPTPTCSAEYDAKNYANIGFRDHVVFCAPTEKDDIDIKRGSSRPEYDQVGVVRELLWKDDSPRGGRRPISRKYRNNKKNISRKKGKKRMSLRHRRSRRRLRGRYHSLRLKN